MEKIKYFVTRFYPDEEGLYELPEGSLLSLISDEYVTVLVPVLEDQILIGGKDEALETDG